MKVTRSDISAPRIWSSFFVTRGGKWLCECGGQKWTMRLCTSAWYVDAAVKEFLFWNWNPVRTSLAGRCQP
ncbi:MAG TPA: hypothetical protein VN577_04840 [Terriglobales bacterium]|nr:hypothetical protein [Terriglobales bacterium]